MIQIQSKLIGSGTTDDPFRVNLPNYVIVGDPDYISKTAVVVIPDDELSTDKSRPEPQKLRKKYRGIPAWDRADVAIDV